MPAVVLERHAEVALVRLNRPERLNAVNRDLRRELPEVLARANADPQVRAVVIAGAGERAFCAGQDLEEGARLGVEDAERWAEELHAMHAAVRALDKPSVAAIVGAAAGAGFQIALHCDLRVAHPEARIGQPEVRTGVGSILGTSFMMWHLPFGLNAELSLMGELISGERAERIGLVNRLVPRGQVLGAALGLARELATRPPNAIRLTKQRMRELTQAAFDDILVAAREYQRRAFESGEPQRLMPELLAELEKRSKT